MTDQETSGRDQFEVDGDSITFTLNPRHSKTVRGWESAREDLGLNRGGPPAVEGVELVSEEPHYYDEDAGDSGYPYGYGPVVLRFDDIPALEAAADRLYDQATDRFEWGAIDVEEVQEIAGRLPTSFDVDEARNDRSLDTDISHSDE